MRGGGDREDVDCDLPLVFHGPASPELERPLGDTLSVVYPAASPPRRGGLGEYEDSRGRRSSVMYPSFLPLENPASPPNSLMKLSWKLPKLKLSDLS
jgi:hypothetical protein